MAVFSRSALVGLAVVLSVLAGAANALSPDFYSTSCPNLASIVRAGMESAVQTEARMGASILRLFFHDCFVNGCDGSILLDGSTGEKNALPNANSVRGYEVIDAIKAQVEAYCNHTVSCADILALAARDGVYLVGGPTWDVPLGRQDSRTPSQSTGDLPGADSNLATLISMFANKGLTAQDMTALSGAHTIGRSRCQIFRNRIYKDKNINGTFANLRRQTCPRSGPVNDTTLAPLDVRTADVFDNAYYQDLVEKSGLLHSDQELFNGGSQDALVRSYSTNQTKFFTDFAAAMVKMGNLLPSGTQTEIRLNCKVPN